MSSPLFIRTSNSFTSGSSDCLLEPLLTPIPLLHTQTAATGPARPKLDRLNTATPLLPRIKGSLYSDFWRGHWHLPWRGHRSAKDSTHCCRHARLRSCVWLVWKITLAVVIGIFLYWWGWQDARDQRLTLVSSTFMLLDQIHCVLTFVGLV